MGRMLIVVVILASLGLAGYFLSQGAPGETSGRAPDPAETVAETTADAPDASPEASLETVEDAPGAALESVADGVAEAVEDAAEALDGANEEAAEAAGELAGDAAAPAEGATDAVRAATGIGTDDAAADIPDTMGNAANEAIAETGDPVTPDQAEGVPEEAGEAVPADLSQVLSVDGFDYDAAVAAVDASSLSALDKRTARSVLETARDNPGIRSEALARARRLLGVEREAVVP